MEFKNITNLDDLVKTAMGAEEKVEQAQDALQDLQSAEEQEHKVIDEKKQILNEYLNKCKDYMATEEKEDLAIEDLEKILNQ